jgi:hypothetical protein
MAAGRRDLPRTAFSFDEKVRQKRQHELTLLILLVGAELAFGGAEQG